MPKVSASDREDFKEYLRNCTDAQVQGVYDNEKAANRRVYASLAQDEANTRGITLS